MKMKFVIPFTVNYHKLEVRALLYKSMEKSVNDFIVHDKFVTGPSWSQQTFFKETLCDQRLSRPNRNYNLVRIIAALPESIGPISSEWKLIFNIFLVWPAVWAVSFFMDDVIDSYLIHIHKSPSFLDQFHGNPITWKWQTDNMQSNARHAIGLTEIMIVWEWQDYLKLAYYL